MEKIKLKKMKCNLFRKKETFFYVLRIEFYPEIKREETVFKKATI